MDCAVATMGDIPRIVALLLRIEKGTRPKWAVGKESPYPAIVPRDVKISLRNIMAQDAGICFTTLNAMIAGVVAPSRINFSVLESYELFWQSNGRDGNKVLRAYEDWSLSMGAKRIILTSMHSLDENDASELRRKLFNRRGYKLSESVWEKRINV